MNAATRRRDLREAKFNQTLKSLAEVKTAIGIEYLASDGRMYAGGDKSRISLILEASRAAGKRVMGIVAAIECGGSEFDD